MKMVYNSLHTLKLKAYIIALLPILILFILFASFLIPEQNKKLLEERKDKLKSAVDIVQSLIMDYEMNYRENPEENLKALQEECLGIIDILRYEKNEFFFILNSSGDVLLHPLQPELYKWNLLNEPDQRGRHIFKELVLGAMREDDIYITSLWQSKYNEQIFEEQILYGRYIWQWDWVVCSSLFTQDIKSLNNQMTLFTLIYILTALILIVLIQMFFITNYISKPMAALLKGIIEIQNNNLKHKIPVIHDDELGRIATQFNSMVEIRNKFEAQLIQSRKMEMVGTLASGVSHDFNNVIGGINGIATLLSDSLESNTPLEPDVFREYVSTLFLCCDRASSIVNQLLGFAQGKTLTMERISLKSVFHHMERLCSVSLNPVITLNINLPSDDLCVMADQGQLEQTILNLCINADHAMTIMRRERSEWGGHLTLESSSVLRRGGRYGRIQIRDDGIGMEPHVLQAIFDPFFTTKDKSEGSGLGLAMAYRIIHDHGGYIDVESQPGKGTEFSVFLPLCEKMRHTAD